MDMINIYIKEVTKRLPEKNREDIALELQSTIYDMLPDDFNEEDVNKVLEDLGNPVALAARYRDRPMHLIGPKFYDIYINILKIVIPIASVIVFITTFIDRLHNNDATTHISMVIVTIFGEATWILLSTAMQAFFWITIVFIILERTVEPHRNEPMTLSGKKWTPNDLKKTAYIPLKKEIKLYEIGFTIFWTALWVTIYFNANYIIGVYEGTDTLTFIMPVFNQETLMAYVIIVMFYMALEIMRAIYMIIVRQWDRTLAIGNTIIYIFSFVILVLLLSDANLFNAEFIQYAADGSGKSVMEMNNILNKTKWIVAIVVIIIGVLDTVSSFKKAKL